jgi:tRNA-splicing ligase RtcB
MRYDPEEMPVLATLSTPNVPVEVWTDDLEEGARRQLINTASLPFVFHHVAAMADVHLGKGATVGSVVATRGAICPAAVGVDIGCGMAAQKLALTADDLDAALLKKLRSEIERSVPVGFHERREPAPAAEEFYTSSPPPESASSQLVRKSARQLGTLGGGNHFIEVCVEEGDRERGVWVMLHSGSRNIGKTLAEEHIHKARDLARLAAVRLPDPDLASFAQNTPEFRTYLSDVLWCQSYAKVNREIMMDAILRQLAHALGKGGDFRDLLAGSRVDCHHNYVAAEHHYGQDVLVTRKGAIRARRGEMGIIPGSMGTGSYIVRGLGNPAAFESAPHGAGRRMSRGEARRRFTVSDLERQTEGVECRKDSGVLDEIPAAYKEIGAVIRKSSDLVEVVARLKQVLCVKG